MRTRTHAHAKISQDAHAHARARENFTRCARARTRTRKFWVFWNYARNLSGTLRIMCKKAPFHLFYNFVFSINFVSDFNDFVIVWGHFGLSSVCRVQNFGERERERARASGSEQLARSLALKLKKCSSRSLARLKIENVSARSLALARHYFQRASARSSRSSLAFFARSSFKLARSSSSLSCFDRDMVVCSNKSKLSTELRLTNWVGEKAT